MTYLCTKCGWVGEPLAPERIGNDVICPRCPYTMLPLRKMTAVEKEQQRRSFVYGNTHLSNPNVTREMVDEAAERLAGGDA